MWEVAIIESLLFDQVFYLYNFFDKSYISMYKTFFEKSQERMIGLEPTTNCLEGSHSTTELHPHLGARGWN